MTVIDGFQQLRKAFGSYPTGVTIVTCMRDGVPFGFTANSFTTVSLDPPQVLFCVGKSRESFQAVADVNSFCVNVLSANQRDLSDRFARSGPTKWKNVEYTLDELDNPMFPLSAAVFSCNKTAMIPSGDHALIIGEVIHYRHRADTPPLVYCQSGYRMLDSGSRPAPETPADRS